MDLKLFSIDSIKSSIKPANFSFTGNLSHDDGIQLFLLSVSEASTVTIRTWSYSGGKNVAGEIVPAGGFDPILTIFDYKGYFINESDDIDIHAGEYDAQLIQNLVGGYYILAITQYPNTAKLNTLANAFLEGSGESKFNGRTCRMALDIHNVNAAWPISSKTSFILFGSGLLRLAEMIRKLFNRGAFRMLINKLLISMLR